jgi:hypothetical protein
MSFTDLELKESLRTLLTPRLQALLSFSDLQRFLFAKKLDVNAALTMIEDWDDWYHNHPLPGQSCSPRDILNDIEDPMEAIHTRLCPISHMGEDKVGRPIYWEKSGLISGHFSELIELLSVDDMLARHVRNSVSCSHYPIDEHFSSGNHSVSDALFDSET